jgi:hypothetical protein
MLANPVLSPLHWVYIYLISGIFLCFLSIVSLNTAYSLLHWQSVYFQSIMANVETKIATFESIIPINVYEIGNKVFFASALSTYSIKCVIEGHSWTLPRNDRLALYGDAVVQSYFCRKWLDAGLEKSTVASCATTPNDDLLILIHRSVDCYPQRCSGKCQFDRGWV